MNVFEVAMKMEQDGKAYYEKLAGQTDLPGLQTVFNGLAADEQKHYETFRAMNEGATLPEFGEGASLEAVRSIFANFPPPDKTLANTPDVLAAYRHAMNVEDESRRFYEKEASEEHDPRIREALLRIAAEEKQHFDILESVCQFVNEPNRFLSGAEISHLE